MKLKELETESIYLLRETAATCPSPVLMYSVGKDSSVLLHLARKAFTPGKLPFPLLHVNTGWKFKEMITFRDQMMQLYDIQLLTYTNEEGRKNNITPFTHSSAQYTHVMKTEALKQALDLHGFKTAIGGARRDKEKSRAKEKIFSLRTQTHAWDPKNQRPEFWQNYNTLMTQDQRMRVFPLSNWTERDIWHYIKQENIPIVPLYFAKARPVSDENGTMIMVDDDRYPTQGKKISQKQVRFRTLGCYPLTAAVESTATSVDEIIAEIEANKLSERAGRLIDTDEDAGLEQKKRDGYF